MKKLFALVFFVVVSFSASETRTLFGVADALRDSSVGAFPKMPCTNNINDVSANSMPQMSCVNYVSSVLENGFPCNYGPQQTSYFNCVNSIPGNGISLGGCRQMPDFNYRGNIPGDGFVPIMPRPYPKMGPMHVNLYKNVDSFEEILSVKLSTVNEIIYAEPERMYMVMNAYGHSIRKVILDDLFKYFVNASKLLEMLRVDQYEQKVLELQIDMDKNKDFHSSVIQNRLKINKTLSEFYLDYLIFYIQQIDFCIYSLSFV